MHNQKPVLTISLLISDRLDTIPRCLDSLKPIMDAIPSELILIDTSKNPEVHKLLLKYTDKVYEFEWCQDFAAARNEGLKRAQGEWFLYLDDDEWFVEYDELITFFQSGEYKKYGCANYQVRNFYNKEYTRYGYASVTRVFRIYDDTKFVGKVHETFQSTKGEQKYLEVIANHTGYIFDSEEKIREHFERNSKILLPMIDEEPDCLRWRAQMVQEYRSVQEWDEIVVFCQKSLSNIKQINSSMERNHLATIYAGTVEALMSLKKFEDAISVCNKILKDERSIELLKARTYYCLAECYAELGEWKSVKKYAERFLEKYSKLSVNQALMREEKGSLIVRDSFDRPHIKGAYSMLIYSELKRGNCDALQKYYECLEWNEEDAIVQGKLVKAIADAFLHMEYIPVFSQIITDVYSKEEIFNYMCAEAQRVEKENEKLFKKVALVYAKADSNFWFIWYCRIIAADASGDKVKIEEAFKGFLKSVLNVFHLPDKLHEIILKYDIQIAKLWEEVLEDKWDEQMTYYVTNHDVECIHRLRRYLKCYFSEEDEKYVAFEKLVQEKENAAKPKIELLEIRNKVLQQITVLCDNGMKKEALQVIQQLKSMFPDDEEIEVWEKELS